MQVNPNTSPSLVDGVDSTAKTVKKAATESDSATFKPVDDLVKSLRELSDARPEVVTKAATLINQKRWPPTETTPQIADLLAINLRKNDD